MNYDISNKHDDYVKLLNLLNFLKFEFENQISNIDNIYSLMIDNCSIDELPLCYSTINENKNSMLEIVEKIDEINNNMISY